MIDVVPSERLLCLAYSRFDGIKLLMVVESKTANLNDTPQMAIRGPQSFDDVQMALVRGDAVHNTMLSAL